jgi:hypothetical protein
MRDIRTDTPHPCGVSQHALPEVGAAARRAPSPAGSPAGEDRHRTSLNGGGLFQFAALVFAVMGEIFGAVN